MPRRLASDPAATFLHHDFERNDLHFLDQLLAHVEPAHEMGRHADRVQLRHQIFGNAVVQHALAFDGRLFRGVECGGVVLEILDQRAGLGTFIENLALALVDHAPAFHGDISFRGFRAAVPETRTGTRLSESPSRGRT